MEKLKQGKRISSPKNLRLERAVEVLELAASRDAYKLLDHLAAAAERRLAEYAKASLQRLGRRPGRYHMAKLLRFHRPSGRSIRNWTSRNPVFRRPVPSAAPQSQRE